MRIWELCYHSVCGSFAFIKSTLCQDCLLVCMSCWDTFVLLLCINVINLSQNECWKIDVLRLSATKFLLEVITILLVICCFCLSDSLAVGEGLFVEQLVCQLELDCCTPATVFPLSTLLSHTVCLGDTNTSLSHAGWLTPTPRCHTLSVWLTSTPVCYTLSGWLTSTPVCHTLCLSG